MNERDTDDILDHRMDVLLVRTPHNISSRIGMSKSKSKTSVYQ